MMRARCETKNGRERLQKIYRAAICVPHNRSNWGGSGQLAEQRKYFVRDKEHFLDQRKSRGPCTKAIVLALCNVIDERSAKEMGTWAEKAEGRGRPPSSRLRARGR